MDEVDIANDRMMADLEYRLAEARSKVRACGPEFCESEDCGEPMTAARRKLGLSYCIDCAGARERRARLFGRI